MQWTVEEFCEHFGACAEARDWLAQNCATPQEAWNKLQPEWLIWAATRPGVMDDRTLRRFACWSVRQVWHLTDERSRRAVEVAEAFAEGRATEAELAAARDSARVAARSAALDSACNAAWDSAWDSAWDYAWDSARGYARDCARVAARNAAWDSAREEQAAWLRANAMPNFERV